MASSYTEEITRLGETYGFQFDFDAYELAARRMSNLDKFLFEKNPEAERKNIYNSMLSSALSAYIISKVNMGDQKSYDMSDFSIGQFIVDFEKVMNVRHHQEDKSTAIDRTPFEGQSFEEVARDAWGRIRQYGKPVGELWADRVARGRFSVKEMKSLTDMAMAKMDGLDGKDPLGENEKDLVNIIEAKRAMDNVRRTRGFWWRRFHPFQNRDEKAYVKMLQERLDKYASNGFPVKQLTEDTAKSILDGQATKLTEFAKTVKSEELNKSEYTDKTAANYEEAKKFISDISLIRQLDKEIQGMLSEGKVKEGMKKVNDNMLSNIASQIHTGADVKIAEMWEKFEKATDPAEKEKILAEGAKATFLDVKLRMNFMRLQEADWYLVAQKITDRLLNHYSPIATDSKYAQYGKSYFMENAEPMDIYKRSPEIKADDYYKNVERLAKAWETARGALGIDKKATLPDLEALRAEDKEREAKALAEKQAFEAKLAEKRRLDELAKAEAKKTPNQRKAEALAKDPALLGEMKSKMEAMTKEAKALKGPLKTVKNGLVVNVALERANDMWKALEGKTPQEVEKLIAEGAKDAFIGVYTSLGDYKLDSKDRLVVAQNVADMAIKKFSPVAFDSKLAKYGERYFMKTSDVENIQALENIEDYKTARSVFDLALKELDSERSVIDLSAEFADKSNTELSPKIEGKEPPAKEKQP